MSGAPPTTPSGRTRARLLFLGHGAERTGPPILLGHLLRGLRATTPWATEVLVARGGPLVPAYQACGPVTVLSDRREPLEPLAAALRRAGRPAAASVIQDRRRRQLAARCGAHDLVYVNAATPPTAALLRALDPPARVPVLVHVHELEVGLAYTLSHEDRRLLLDRADQLVAASRPVAEVLIERHGVAADRITICEEFVDVGAVRPAPRAEARRRLGIPPGALAVGSVGLPDVRKDPDHLLRALRALPTDLAPWVVWIGGDPRSADGQRVAAEAERLGLHDRFVHLGHVDDPSTLLHALDVFALPAREDAMPLAALEAAAAGLPIVCFRAGGIADLCDRGAGTAVGYPDTRAFADALAVLLANPRARAAVGERARELAVADHDLTVGVERIARVIDRMLGAEERTPR